jgi:hypothetical protein
MVAQRLALALWTAIIAPALGVGACRTAPVAPLPLALTVDSSAYHRQGQSPVTVSFTLADTGKAPILVAQCNQLPAPEVDWIVDGGWRYTEGAFCNGGSAPPLRLAPGDSVRGSVVLANGGHYRLRVTGAVPPATESREVARSAGFDVW